MLTRSLLTIEVLLPFFPFASDNARRVWDWKWMAWIILAVMSLVTLFLF